MRRDEAAGDSRIAEPHGSSERTPRLSVSDKGRRLSTAGDQPLIVRAAQRALERRGFHVLHAHGAATALELARHHRDGIDVLLTDISMPGVGGDELAALVRQQAPKIAIVYMSGYPAGPTVRHEVQAGRARFLSKPFDNDNLVSEIAKAMRSSGDEVSPPSSS